MKRRDYALMVAAIFSGACLIAANPSPFQGEVGPQDRVRVSQASNDNDRTGINPVPTTTTATTSTDQTATPAPATTILIVFDFESPGNPGLGKKLADSLRLRAARLPGITLVDPFSVAAQLANEEAPLLDSSPQTVAAIAAKRFGAEVALWGRASHTAAGEYTIDTVGLDLRPGSAQPFLRKHYTAAKPQLVNARCDEILTDLTGVEKANRPKEADPEAAARAQVKPQNLVINGDFEQLVRTGPGAGVDPVGWERPNGLTTFIERQDALHGRSLHMDTDVYESDYNRWIKEFAAGAATAKAPRKTPTQGLKYDTVGGNYGVHFYSDPIPVTPGRTYRVEIDYRSATGDFFFPKLFIRGWADVEGQDRIVYDGYLALRSLEKTGDWKHNQRLVTVPLPEALGGRKIKYLKLMIYAYWPPGDYYFDNVALYEVVDAAPPAMDK
jgi:hypothetical protein